MMSERAQALEQHLRDRLALLTDCTPLDEKAGIVLNARIDELQKALAAAPPVGVRPQPIMVDRDADLRRELRAYLDTLNIHGDNIGDIRRNLFMPWDSQWNGWVRDETALREKLASLSPVEPPPPAEDEDDDEVPVARPEGAPDAWSAPLRKPVVPKILSTDDFYALLRILEVLPADPFLSALQSKLSDEERRQHGNQASHLSGPEFVREIERVEALIQSRVQLPALPVEPTPEPCQCQLYETCPQCRVTDPLAPVKPTTPEPPDEAVQEIEALRALGNRLITERRNDDVKVIADVVGRFFRERQKPSVEPAPPPPAPCVLPLGNTPERVK